MRDRVGIPALSLLGLSFTTCVDRTDEDPVDPIVGDWTVIQVDNEAYPMTYNGPGYNARLGWSMSITPELVGEFSHYQISDYMGIDSGYFNRGPLTVDASKAPDYRLVATGVLPNITVEPDEPYSDDDAVTTTATTYTSDTGYDTDDTGDTDATTGIPILPPTADDLTTPSLAAPGAPPLVLRCTLTGESALDCQREPTEGIPDKSAVHWRFKRVPEGETPGV